MHRLVGHARTSSVAKLIKVTILLQKTLMRQSEECLLIAQVCKKALSQCAILPTFYF